MMNVYTVTLGFMALNLIAIIGILGQSFSISLSKVNFHLRWKKRN